MKKSLSKYCGECQKDFVPGEIVYFTWLENHSFCGNCKRKLVLINDWETRQIPKRGEEI
ncbi:hypothetical protein [Sporosarcina psychrophila]|uniref:Uncharacterized protein n=1 Tax=Sporosarcina psychrophila TaxID=1476 RepID=A0ABV2K9W8_SPOPS